MELDDDEQWEPYESRGSSTVLLGAEAEMPRPTHSKHCELDSIYYSLALKIRAWMLLFSNWSINEFKSYRSQSLLR